MNENSGQPCGCDPGADWTCEQHRIPCEQCDGRGERLDAPADALGVRPYWQRCPACDGRGYMKEPTMERTS